MAMKAELELREILLTTGLVQPLSTTGAKNRVSAICRQVPGQERPWLEVVTNLLKDSVDDPEIRLHVCRQYIWKDERMVFGWHVSFDGKGVKDLDRQLDWLRGAVKGVEPVFGGPPAPRIVPEPKDVPPPIAPTIVPLNLLEAEDVNRDEEVRRARVASHTTASPRAPDRHIPDPVSPGEFKPSIRIVKTGVARDSKNRTIQTVETEFPLPHVYVQDMNAPNEKGKGASTLG
jgi:hypothetical protein